MRQFLQNWNVDRQTCSNAINYRISKDTFGFEDYFNILDEKDFLIFCKFQLAIIYQLSVVDGKIQNEKTESVFYVILTLALYS